jgi:hypothetical protein
MTNILHDVSRCSKHLIAMGKRKEAEEMRTRVFAAQSPEEAEKIMDEYFEFSKSDDEEDEE